MWKLKLRLGDLLKVTPLAADGIQARILWTQTHA